MVCSLGWGGVADADAVRSGERVIAGGGVGRLDLDGVGGAGAPVQRPSIKPKLLHVASDPNQELTFVFAIQF
jgi:hypothetical protein